MRCAHFMIFEMEFTVNKIRHVLLFVLMSFISISLSFGQESRPAKPYEANWQSLSMHRTPDWLLDAKFGIYAHWGLYAVPEYRGPRYGKEMYEKGSDVHEYHKKRYGDPADFGYSDFIPLFTADEFDAAEWAKMIKESGARFAGICVIHHDGFGLWDSDVYKWNVGKVGPKRDLYGELAEEIRKNDMKLAATFHHARTFNWRLPKNITEQEKKNWDLFDPQFAELFWNEVTGKKEDFARQWQTKVLEVIDKYKPDFLWFDGMASAMKKGALPEKIVTSVFAHYFNSAQQWDAEVDIANKLPASKRYNFPEEFGFLCYENSRNRPDFPPREWLTDRAMGYPWGYVKNKKYIAVDNHINSLVDIVSRNGVFMLSLTPKANGEIPKEEKHIMAEMGKWLSINGEAIYSTKPWRIFGEGPSPVKKYNKKKGRYDWLSANFTAQDVRFTTKGKAIYAIALDWPENGELTIKSMNSNEQLSSGGINSIEMLGLKNNLQWSRNGSGLKIDVPKEKPCDYAFAFKITLKGELTSTE